MQCPKCGSVLNPGATFCTNCGQLFAVTSAGAVAIGAKKPVALWVLAGIGGLLALTFGMAAVGILRVPGLTPAHAVRMHGDSGVALKAPAKEPAPAVVVPSEGDTMPDDVRAWLEHLRRIEEKKNALHRDQSDSSLLMGKMLEGMNGLSSVEDVRTLSDPDAGMPDPRGKVEDFFEQLAAPWRSLRTEFLTTGPKCPKECEPIRDAYADALTGIPEKIAELTNLVHSFNPSSDDAQSQAQSARSEARQIGAGHKAGIDANFSATDRKVAEICQKYNTKKWFDINSGDLGGNSLFKGF